MILAHIVAKDKEQSLQIVEMLIEKNLLWQAAVSEKTTYLKKGKNKKLKVQKQLLIIGMTKALLFKAINKELREHFPDDMPLLYSIPIVYMDESQTNALRAGTAKV